jgi:hypothetical protein
MLFQVRVPDTRGLRTRCLRPGAAQGETRGGMEEIEWGYADANVAALIDRLQGPFCETSRAWG